MRVSARLSRQIRHGSPPCICCGRHLRRSRAQLCDPKGDGGSLPRTPPRVRRTAEARSGTAYRDGEPGNRRSALRRSPEPLTRVARPRYTPAREPQQRCRVILGTAGCLGFMFTPASNLGRQSEDRTNTADSAKRKPDACQSGPYSDPGKSACGYRCDAMKRGCVNVDRG